MSNEVVMYTDGACRGNPGSCGYGAVKSELTIGECVFKCQAGCPRIDRDLNAAINLREYAAVSYAEA